MMGRWIKARSSREFLVTVYLALHLLHCQVGLSCDSIFCNASKLDPTANGRSRLESSIFAESALIDKETGRIYWEAGGSGSTLSKSLISKFGLGQHTKATLLSLILLVTLLGHFHQWLRSRLEQSSLFQSMANHKYLFLVAFLLRNIILIVPKFDDWFLAGVVILYFLEAYTCKASRFLSNLMSSPDEVEDFIEKLRLASPKVYWRIRTFHYEQPIWYRPGVMWKIVMGLFFKRPSEYQQIRLEDDTITQSPDVVDMTRYTLWPFTRKRISREVESSYQYAQCVDETIVGLWQRARAKMSLPSSSLSNGGAPFARIYFTKLLVLADAKARQNYFSQQSKFISDHCSEDDLAEFTTKIEVPAFRSLVMAVRPNALIGPESQKQALKIQFWIFTLLGMTVPYRIWLSNQCDEIRVSVVKETHAKLLPKPLKEESLWSSGWGLFGSWGSKKSVESSFTMNDQKEVFRQTMRRLELYKSDDRDDPLEPMKKIFKQLTQKDASDQSKDEAPKAITGHDDKQLNATQFAILEEMREAVVTAELVNANLTKAMDHKPDSVLDETGNRAEDSHSKSSSQAEANTLRDKGAASSGSGPKEVNDEGSDEVRQ